MCSNIVTIAVGHGDTISLHLNPTRKELKSTHERYKSRCSRACMLLGKVAMNRSFPKKNSPERDILPVGILCTRVHCLRQVYLAELSNPNISEIQARQHTTNYSFDLKGIMYTELTPLDNALAPFSVSRSCSLSVR